MQKMRTTNSSSPLLLLPPARQQPLRSRHLPLARVGGLTLHAGHPNLQATCRTRHLPPLAAPPKPYQPPPFLPPARLHAVLVLPHAPSPRQLARVAGLGGTSQAPRQHTYKQVGVSAIVMGRC